MNDLQRAHVDGVHCLRLGDAGPPVVLVHGLDGSAANWIPVGRVLAADHRVLAIDLPGFGRTPLGRHRSRMEDHARLVTRLTRSWTGEQPVALAGNSMGGVVAALAAGAPGLAHRVTLVASALPRAGTGAIEWGIVPSLLSLWMPGAATAVAGARNATPPTQRVAELLELCVAPGTRRDLPRDAIAEMVDVAAARDRRDHVRGWGRSARSLWRWLARRGAFDAAVERVEADGVLVTGAVDPIVPRSSAAAFAGRHPSWHWHELPGIGHVPPLEAPLATASAIVGAP